jgi:hypothetical protein
MWNTCSCYGKLKMKRNEEKWVRVISCIPPHVDGRRSAARTCPSVPCRILNPSTSKLVSLVLNHYRHQINDPPPLPHPLHDQRPLPQMAPTPTRHPGIPSPWSLPNHTPHTPSSNLVECLMMTTTTTTTTTMMRFLVYWKQWAIVADCCTTWVLTHQLCNYEARNTITK